MLSNVAVLGLDPGAMPTDICRRDVSFFIRVISMKILMPILNPVAVYLWPNGLLRTTTKSASDALYAALDTTTLGDHPKGVYLNGTSSSAPSKAVENDQNRELLWRDSIRYAKVIEGDTSLDRWL